MSDPGSPLPRDDAFLREAREYAQRNPALVELIKRRSNRAERAPTHGIGLRATIALVGLAHIVTLLAVAAWLAP